MVLKDLQDLTAITDNQDHKALRVLRDQGVPQGQQGLQVLLVPRDSRVLKEVPEQQDPQGWQDLRVLVDQQGVPGFQDPADHWVLLVLLGLPE